MTKEDHIVEYTIDNSIVILRIEQNYKKKWLESPKLIFLKDSKMQSHVYVEVK